jgi:hypothetical protein
MSEDGSFFGDLASAGEHLWDAGGDVVDGVAAAGETLYHAGAAAWEAWDGEDKQAMNDEYDAAQNSADEMSDAFDAAYDEIF